MLEIPALLIVIIAFSTLLVVIAPANTKFNTILCLFTIVSYSILLGMYVLEEKTQIVKQVEQSKYKQEIVYSLKDGKYLPTDTIYTEIK